jgi:acetolactate synthase-1/2/3 large subunit
VVPTVYRAYRTAIEGEPGPVYIELPANLQLFTGEVDQVPPFDGAIDRPPLDPDAVVAAVDLLSRAAKPGIFVGWGARHVADDIRRIAEHLGAPVATTLQGLAAFPADHPLHTGMGFGPSSVPAAQNAFRDCDAMLAVGTRFAEICTGSFGAVPPENLVHVDINAAAIGRNHPTPVALHADSRDAVPAIARLLLEKAPARDGSAVQRGIAADKAAWIKEWNDHDSRGRVNPGRFFESLRRRLDPGAIVVADDGNHTFLTAELMPIFEGGNFLSPTDFNCMGYCVPACIGAKLAQPRGRSWESLVTALS